MQQLVGLLVGMHFHPPAPAVLAHLPQGARLIIEPEPTNPYDPHAMRVLVDLFQVPGEQINELELKLAGFGMDFDSLAQEGRMMLGHLASAIGKPYAKAREKGDPVSAGCIDFERAQVRAGVLEFGPTGAPLVRAVDGHVDEDEKLSSGENNPDV